jgi:hypothetical protein
MRRSTFGRLSPAPEKEVTRRVRKRRQSRDFIGPSFHGNEAGAKDQFASGSGW